MRRVARREHIQSVRTHLAVGPTKHRWMQLPFVRETPPARGVGRVIRRNTQSTSCTRMWLNPSDRIDGDQPPGRKHGALVVLHELRHLPTQFRQTILYRLDDRPNFAAEDALLVLLHHQSSMPALTRHFQPTLRRHHLLQVGRDQGLAQCILGGIRVKQPRHSSQAPSRSGCRSTI
jgi:hypothetical protein